MAFAIPHYKTNMDTSIEIINRLYKELQSRLPIKPGYQQNLDKKFRLEFNYNSNHIEGNTLTYGETELLLIFDKTTGNHDLREYEEMKAHDVAFEMIKEWAADKERPLTETSIKNLHEVLLVRPFWKDAITPDGQPTRRLIETGHYKKYPNSVRLQNGEMFHYTSPEETPIQMGELIRWFREEEEKKELHAVALAALLHYKFVRIHPFDDGNGRISRLLMNYVLLKNNFPPVIIKSADKKNYLFALNQADTGNYAAFIKYMAEQLTWSLEMNIKAAKGEVVDEPGDWSKKLLLLKNKLGDDPNEQVMLRFGQEAVIRLLKDSIIPLGFAWEESLQKFDSFFKSRTIIFLLGEKRLVTEHFNNSFADNLKEQSAGLAENLLPHIMKLSCNPLGMRGIDNNISIYGGEIIFTLYDNYYEAIVGNNKKSFSNLYHKQLTQAEIDEVVNLLSNTLYAIIEDLSQRK